MKKIILVAALATLGACSREEAPAAEATEEAAAAPAAETMAADGKPSHGKYEVTMADGKMHTTDVKPDGTYTVTGADGTVSDTGKWVQKSPAEYCETSDKAGSKEKCYAEAVDDKGVYTSKDPDTGDVATVVRVEG